MKTYIDKLQQVGSSLKEGAPIVGVNIFAGYGIWKVCLAKTHIDEMSNQVKYARN